MTPEPDQHASLGEMYSDYFLDYASYVILERAVPHLGDGLKPVQRRILHSMKELDDGRYNKVANVIGNTMKYHPHGDQAIYDALVRLAQDFAQRYPLIDGQGNFGNIDGDNAAAMRYTEARLTAFAEALLSEIDQDTVDFRETYDGEDNEPLVLPMTGAATISLRSCARAKPAMKAKAPKPSSPPKARWRSCAMTHAMTRATSNRPNSASQTGGSDGRAK